jgi:hypothetical protein
VLVAVAGCLVAPRAAADDDGHRLGVAMILGGGGGAVLHPGPLAGPVAFTDFGAEVLGEIRPWGGFARVDYLSTGGDARWTSWAFSGGTEYRLFGTTRRTALFLRGGLTFELLTGNTAGCPVIVFVPSSCNLIGATPPTFDVTADMLGVIAGARVEVPLTFMYLAFSANFVPTFAFARSDSGTLPGNQGSPSGTLELRFDIEAGLRQIKKSETEVDDPVRTRRRTRSVYSDGVP